MKLLRGKQVSSNPSQAFVATIGNFDGVHIGHQAILNILKTEALKRKIPLLVFLFEPQPCEFFKHAQMRLTSLREKIRQLQSFGVDDVYCFRFNQSFASISAIDFCQKTLFSTFNIQYLLVGKDFRFGNQRLGNLDLLKTEGAKVGCQVVTCEDILHDGERVSSTKIREALKMGKFPLATSLLGRPYSLYGKVIYGAGLGRQWGIPTANINLIRPNLSLHGIYCVTVKYKHAFLQGVASIGFRPMVSGTRKILEVHLLDFDENLYGQWIEVIFLKKIRDEAMFSSMDDLITQIKHDIESARTYFLLQPPHSP